MKPPSKRTLLILSCWIMAAMFAAQAEAITIRSDRTAAPHNELAELFPATGYFGFNSEQHCTGTLISPTQVLTAAHCVDFDSDGQPDDLVTQYSFGLELNLPDALIPNVASIAIHPNWATSAGEPGFDFAILTLDTPITTVQPALVTNVNPVGQRGVAVGYGIQGTGTSTLVPSNANNKMAIENTIDLLAIASSISEQETLQFDFDHPNGSTSSFGAATPLDLEGGTASGDSGSPLMAEFGEAWFLTGILHTGYNDFGVESQYGDVSVYAPVLRPSNLSFLQDQGVRIITDTTPLPGDANLDYWVDATDLDLWKTGYGQGITRAAGDTNGDDDVDGEDFLSWQRNFSSNSEAVASFQQAVPEPTAILLAAYPLACFACFRKQRERQAA